jgi:hypothetical protein
VLLGKGDGVMLGCGLGWCGKCLWWCRNGNGPGGKWWWWPGRGENDGVGNGRGEQDGVGAGLAVADAVGEGAADGVGDGPGDQDPVGMGQQPNRCPWWNRWCLTSRQ